MDASIYYALEHGMAAPDRHIRILLWAAGLNDITQTEGLRPSPNACVSYWGPTRAICQPGAAGYEPKYWVGGRTGSLLSNETAHGLPFHQRFRKTQDSV